jgi:cobalamin biosynthesis Mg chelatase CobN
MNLGKRHLGAPGLGHYASVLVSAIALALALFAVPAHAEECTSSSCVQYSPSLPKAEGGHTPTHHQQTPAKASKTGDGGGTAPTNPSGQGGSNEVEKTEESESSPEEGGVAAGHDGGSGQGKAGGSANPGGESAHQPSQTASGQPVSHGDDGGSSPLVPILIAIAVLAAISVAVVMIRQRRQRGGADPTATASPEAN